MGLDNDDGVRYDVLWLTTKNYDWVRVSMFGCEKLLWNITRYVRLGWVCVNMSNDSWVGMMMWKYKDGYKRGE